MWGSGHAGIHGNEAAGRAAKEALEKEPIVDLIPFSDLKWQKEWDEAVIVSNKLHEILLKLSDKLLSFCKTRKEDAIVNRVQI